MKSLLLFAIRIYRVLIPESIRPKCLFKESCSKHIFRIAKEKGFIAGIKALRYRFKNCRPNYYLIENNGKKLLITAQNEVIEEEFIDERIIERKIQ